MLNLNSYEMSVVAKTEENAQKAYEMSSLTEKMRGFLLQKGFCEEFVSGLTRKEYHIRMARIKEASDNLNSVLAVVDIKSFGEYEDKKVLLSEDNLQKCEEAKQLYLQSFWPKADTFRNVIVGAVAVPTIEGKSERYALDAYRFSMDMSDFNKVKRQIAEDNKTLRSYFNDVSARQAYLDGMIDDGIDHSRDREVEEHDKYLASLSEEDLILMHLTRKLSTVVASAMPNVENPLRGSYNNPVILKLGEIREYMRDLSHVSYKSSFTGKEVKLSSPVTRILIFKDFVDNGVISEDVLLYITDTRRNNLEWTRKLLNGEINKPEETKEVAERAKTENSLQPLPKKVEWANYKK